MEQKRVATLNNKRKFNWASMTIIGLTLLLGIGLSVSSKIFLTYQNIHDLLFDTSFMFFGVIGFTYLMIMGEIDLSVGSMYAFSGMFLGLQCSWGVPLVIGLPVTLIAAIAIGLINGLLVVRFRVPSMMVTLGMMTALRGLATMICSNLYGYYYPEDYNALSKFAIKLGNNELFLLIIVMVVLIVVLEFMLHRTSVFRKMYYVGENLDTARIYGIKSGKIKIITFISSAFTAAIGGIMIGSRIHYAEPVIGIGYEFQMLTAAVLGGASLFGGKGSILRATVSLLLLQMISKGMIIHNIEPLLQQIIVGIILLIAVFLDTRTNKLASS